MLCHQIAFNMQFKAQIANVPFEVASLIATYVYMPFKEAIRLVLVFGSQVLYSKNFGGKKFCELVPKIGLAEKTFCASSIYTKGNQGKTEKLADKTLSN